MWLQDSIRARPGYEELDLRLKWPNDIYYGADTKLGGVLVSSSFAEGEFRKYTSSPPFLVMAKPFLTDCVWLQGS